MPKASIVIATYNYSAVLPYSVASALEQTEEDIEVIVVGDACTDDSGEVVDSIDDPRLRWFNLPERAGHQFGPNNKGIELASSPVIFYLGHDDILLPRHVELLLNAFSQGADVAYGITARIAGEGEPIGLAGMPRPHRPGQWIPPTGLAHRKILVERAGGWTDYRELDVPPELDLTDRFTHIWAKFNFVPRLTAVKLPAAVRPDVYKKQPSHEQELWLNRVRQNPDLESELLSALFQRYWGLYWPGPYLTELKRFLGFSLHRIKRKFGKPNPKGERIDLAKRRKGAED